ncbi:MAG: two-component system chemotaxis response regulator CheY [Flavobacteriales bacterium]|jgi:two-component system chemotaxis response regulator CheY
MLRLLVVDDSNIIRRKIERSCIGGRFNVVGLAKNGFEALEMFESLDPHVVTMDLTMPQMDGIECVGRIIKRAKHTRILVVSALSDIETGIQALELGARGFLCKPFSDEQLRSALNDLVLDINPS